MITSLVLGSIVTPVKAADTNSNVPQSTFVLQATLQNGELVEFDMNGEPTSRTFNTESEVTQNSSVIVEITPDGNVNVVNSIPLDTRSNVGGSNQNIYWKGYVSVTYSGTSSNCTFSRVDGYWTQLRGNSYLSNRSVYYATSGSYGQAKTSYPSGNTFAYQTGFSTMKTAMLGATSSCVVNTSSTSISLSAQASVTF